ncbi:MAG: SDR family oxidoreductase [Chloroflexota bacterium]
MSTMESMRAVVVGGSGGIGGATVQRFLRAGATVYSLARHLPPTDARPEDGGGPGRLHQRSMDATDAAAVERCLADIVAEGDLDVVVYCAGLNVPDRELRQLTPDTWRSMIAANLDGAYFTIGSCLPSIRRRQGTIILVSSASALWTNQSGAAYQAAKAGLMALARAGNFDEHTHGVRFTTIFPGLVDTPHLDHRPRPPSQRVRAQSLTPDDVASTCEFVATLPPRVCIPELVILPTALQTPGNTCIE